MPRPPCLFLSTITALGISSFAISAVSANAAGVMSPGASNSTAAETPVQAINLATEGPMIELLAPENGGIYTSPIGIEIAFAPKDGAAVDLSTLKVTVVSTTVAGVFEIDITEDIIDYATEEGIKAGDAEIPAGEHVVTIEVADDRSRLSQKQLSITVREESVLERRANE